MHIPFSLVLTVLTLALACVPAVLIWTIFSDLMDSTTNLLHTSTTTGTDGLAAVVQDLLLRESMYFLNARISVGDMEVVSQETLLYSTGLANLNLRPNTTDLGTQVISRIIPYNFNVVNGNSLFSYISMVGSVYPNGGTVGKAAYWIVWQSLNLDIYKAMAGLPPFGRTLYLCTVLLSPDELTDEMVIWYVDQTTGTPLIPLSRVKYPWQGFYTLKQKRAGWGSDLYVNPYSGQVELNYVKTVVIGNQSFEIGFGMNTQTLSEELRSQLTEPTDRLFLFFRNPVGHLIAASHGKYFSLSDVDMRYVNPLANPPNMSAYRLYTCLDSNDALILEACQKLYAQYRNWSLIPASRQEMPLAGRRYWVAVGYSTSSLSATIVLLKDRESVMGGIDATTAKVQRDTDAKRATSALVFGVATAVAAVVPLLIGLWLGGRLLRLARGMDRIAKLDFSGRTVSSARFREIHDFQQSFRKMERGLQAFGQFVPSAVVTRLVAGNIHTEDKMETSTLTVMFADIESFSTLSESMPPPQLAEVCTEYFEAMCKHVVSCDGTIDKFIGDCIMAMWNAPLPQPGHERQAVTAALRMQAEVLELHTEWLGRGLPALKFRIGIHTGNCLVGNFGCSHRVSYTCLGDNVNLASRLEALNKKFGTTLCVSQSTYAGCQEDFYFRLLSKVTVPGRSEVLAVYEVLCATGTGEDAEVMSLPQSPCSLNDLSVQLTKPMLDDDLRRQPADSDGGPAPAAAKPPSLKSSKGTRQPSDRLLIVSSAQRTEDEIPYHWGWHNRHTVLKEAAQYEAAYAALVEGRYAACRQAVERRPSDKSWKALASQLDQQLGSNDSWDGVFYFREK